MSGMLLGNYRLIEKIGQGGMGEVWKAEDTRLGRTVAIKILPQAVAADAQAIARMKREARTAAQIYHPNIATIHAFEEAGDRIFIVMEYVEGEPLTQLIRRGPVAEADVCRIGRSVADALAEAHEKGIIHRDIKPDNIMVKGARVKVLDFGIAKQVEQHGVDANDPTTVLTQQGMIIGTVFYMSPEQALGKPLDARTDLFSLGVVLYEAVTGRRPFHGDSATDTITRIVRDEAPLPQNVSRGLATIIHRCLRKDREDRFAGAHELSQALEAQLSVAPTAPLTTPAAPSAPAATTVLTTAPQIVAKPRSSPWMWIALIALFVIVTMVLSQRTKERKEPVVSATTDTTGSSVPRALGSSGAEQTVTAAPVIEEPATTTTMPPTPTTQPPPEEPRTRVTEKPVPAPPAPTTTPVQPTADADYNAGVTYLVQRQPMQARESFEAALAKDPHHARAHFRLGEMALFLRDVDGARRELEAARADSDRLDARELRLTDLGLAVLDGDRPRAQALFQEIQRTSPNDPDLLRFRAMVMELRGEGPRPFRRGRLRPH